MNPIRRVFVLITALAAIAAVAALTRCGPAPESAANAAAAPLASAAPAQPAAPPAPIVGERVRMLVSGSMQGHLEPCGCAQGQIGGLARRMAHVQETGYYDLLIEGGDLVADDTQIDLEKAYTAITILFGMRRPYDALGVGPRDLELPFQPWKDFLGGYRAPVVASDLQSTAGEWPGQAFLEKDVRGTKVRIASLTMALPAPLPGAAPLPLQLLAPAAAWQRALLGAPPETLRVLLVHADPERVRALAKELQPPPDLVLGIDPSFTEPPREAETVGKVPVVFPGIRGRVMLELTLARAADGPRLTQYEPIPLSGSPTKPDAGQDPDVKKAILQHRDFVKQEGVLKAMANLDPPADGRTYVGSESCKTCHEQDWAIWKNSLHSHAWETLVKAENDPKRYGWPVTHYPDCVSCHVVGYRQPGGFITFADTPQLVDVGCERCHGPGSAHVASPLQNKLGKVGGGTPSVVCTQCHDFEQTPDFDYMRKWPSIQHGLVKAKAPKGK